MAKDEPKDAVSGRTQIHRLYEGAGESPNADIGGMTRAQRAAKYHHDMRASIHADLAEARSVVVAKMQAAPGAGRPDTKFDRWYDPADWAPGGRYIGAGPCIKPPQPDAGVLELERAARGVSAAAEMKAHEAKIASKGLEAALSESLGVDVQVVAALKKRGRPAKAKP